MRLILASFALPPLCERRPSLLLKNRLITAGGLASAEFVPQRPGLTGDPASPGSGAPRRLARTRPPLASSRPRFKHWGVLLLCSFGGLLIAFRDSVAVSGLAA